MNRRKLLMGAAVAAAYRQIAHAQSISPQIGGGISRGFDGGISSGGGGSLASLYLGQVATRTFMPQRGQTSFSQVQSRSSHIARDTITAMKIIVPNWAMNNQFATASGTEFNFGTTNTVFASCEYPAGTFTRLTWASATSVVLPAGNTGTSDLVNLTTSIPNGATFWIRIFQSFSGDGVYVNNNVAPGVQGSPTAGDSLALAVSGMTDLTMSGTITDGFGGVLYYTPTCILGMTRKPALALIGDSRVNGQQDSVDATLDVGELARSVGSTLAYANFGACGDRARLYVANSTQRQSFLQYFSHAIVQTGVNDMYEDSRTSAQVLADRLAIISAIEAMGIPAANIYETTIPPETSDAGGTTIRSVPNNTSRIAVNVAVRAGGRGIAGFFDIASVVESVGSPGTWPGQTADGIHENPGPTTGYGLIKSSGIVNPALFHRP